MHALREHIVSSLIRVRLPQHLFFSEREMGSTPYWLRVLTKNGPETFANICQSVSIRLNTFKFIEYRADMDTYIFHEKLYIISNPYVFLYTYIYATCTTCTKVYKYVWIICQQCKHIMTTNSYSLSGLTDAFKQEPWSYWSLRREARRISTLDLRLSTLDSRPVVHSSTGACQERAWNLWVWPSLIVVARFCWLQCVLGSFGLPAGICIIGSLWSLIFIVQCIIIPMLSPFKTQVWSWASKI